MKLRYLYLLATVTAAAGAFADSPASTRTASAPAIRQGTQLLGARPDSTDVSVPTATKTRRSIPGVPGRKLKFGVIKSNDDAWTNSTAAPGYYTIDAADGTLSLQHRNASMNGVVAAAKVGDTMYAISYGEDAIYYSKYNTNNWNSIGSHQEIDNVNSAADLAYDPLTNKVYGFFYQEEDYAGEWTNFGTFNLTTGEAEPIKTMEREVYACAAGDNGDIYWLSSTQLGSINPAEPDNFSYLGGPQVYPEGLGNTMAWDPASKRLYALTTTSDMKNGQRIYTSSFWRIDPTPRSVTKELIREFDSRQYFSGMFLLPEEISIYAPDVVTDATVSFTDPAHPLKGTVTVTAPTRTHAGAALTQPVIIIIEAGGEEHAIFDVAPGATVTSEAYDFAAGLQTITVTAATSEERGEAREVTVFAGLDIPAAPSDVVLTEVGGKPHLTWTAPSRGANGGNIDTESLTYTVRRMTDNVTVANALRTTEFTDESYTPSQAAVWYTVTATTEQGESAPATSNRLAVGVHIEPTYVETFDTQAGFDLWSVINAEAATSTWQYSASDKNVQYRYDDSRAAGDDWLIYHAVRLEPGKRYLARYSYRALNSRYPESFTVALGTTPTADGMTRELTSHPSVSNTRVEDASVPFTVDTAGDYFIGFHATSEPYMYILELDNLGIALLDKNVPAAPGNLTVTPSSRGALQATISMTAPSEDADGKQLTALAQVSVFRTDLTAPVKVFTAPQPGEALSFTDTSLGESGSYTYYVLGSNEAGEGIEARASAFIGTDVPDAVRNLVLSEADGKAVITWDAPTTGRNGGWFDPSLLTYSVYRYWGDLTCIAEHTTTTRIEDTSLVIPEGEQIPATYAVMPYAGDKAGRTIASDYLLLGDPFPAPLTENFANADMAFYPWMSVTDEPLNSAWTLDAAGTNPPASDYSGDGGLATFHSAGEKTGVGSEFMSPKISIAGLNRPTASFALYHSHIDGTDTPETVQLFVAPDGGERVAVSPVYARDNGTPGWRRYSVDLSQIPDCSYLRFIFRGITAGGADVYLDAFTVEEGRTVDAAIAAAEGPTVTARGEKVPFSVRVDNLGNSSVSGAAVEMSVDGTVVATQHLSDIAAGMNAEARFEHAFVATGNADVRFSLLCSDDEHAANNSNALTVKVVEPVFAPATLLTASVADGKVRLQWAPATEHGAVTDDFESYDDWAIDNIGDWIMADRDFDQTVYISAGSAIPGAPTEYPHCQEPKAWQVCNADWLGINIWPEGTPHSGDKMLMASAGIHYVNADWAISPMLNGSEQTVSFFAKAFTAQDTPEERLRVLYSTGSTRPEDFICLHTADYLSVRDSWTEFRYTVPEGARRFAIECVSDNAFALFVDDVAYNDPTVPVSALTGYEITRNGEVIATVTEPVYTDATPAGGKNSYGVTALYSKGRSAAATADVDLSGIDELPVESLDPNGEYFTLQGIRVQTPAPGIYLIRHAGDTAFRKVILR